MDIEYARSLDRDDPLSGFRDRFVIADPDMCYLDGNSLGRLPKATAQAVQQMTVEGWGGELVTGWSHWIDMAQTVGDRLGSTVLGARAGQVLATDTTSVNLYRLALAAIKDRPGRSTIVVDEANFPTDRYILQGIAADLGMTLVTIPNEDPNVAECERITPDLLAEYVDEDVALICLQVINYRSGARQDVPALTEVARLHGAHLLWDASHAVGALDLQFDAWGVDLAIGCTYKYCNSGPGSPAWLYIRSDIQDRLTTPIDGWFAQRDQFTMGPQFDRASGMRGFQIASPSIVGLTAVDTSMSIIQEAGIAAIEAKAAAGTSFMVELFQQWLEPLGFGLETPLDPAHRGGHLSLTHDAADRIAAAMREVANVIPDYRKPNTIRVAVAPLYTSYEEMFIGFERTRDLVASGRYRDITPIEGGVT
ncbi:MAG TPA: aminotransferase class V-fold PLP-dependent enzyme [Candidatus Nanopelagicales bacterium]|nr:aminotransferase class V-fold PLP-dependent enzyme [Candidatus Nanopelagicales bacterium]